MNKVRVVVIAIILLTVFTSFGMSQTTCADDAHCGHISADETRSDSGNVHRITCDVIVDHGVVLTIESGVIIKFDLGNSLTIEGTLRVLGTGTNPVYFTSIRDDGVGGDTNGDGTSIAPFRGEWNWIEFTATSDDASSLIDHAVIRYGGESLTPYQGAVHLSEASPTIQNTTFNENEYCVLTADLRSFPTLTGNTYENNAANALCLRGGTVDQDTT